MADAAQRQVVGLKEVLQNDLLGGRHGAEMAADEPVHRTGADVALGVAVFLPDAEARAGHHRQVLGRMGLLITAIQGLVQLDGILDAHEGVDADAVAIADEADGLVGGHNAKHGVSAFRDRISGSIIAYRSGGGKPGAKSGYEEKQSAGSVIFPAKKLEKARLPPCNLLTSLL